MTTKFVTRFAPSPTGRLHLGHAWSAMLAHDAARAANGVFLLRIEDIDTVRCRAEYIDAIYEDLFWLGLPWDGDVIIQSQRAHAYAGALEKLRDLNIVYRCRCTRAEVAANAPHGDAGPRYPGTCRAQGYDESQPFCWRIDSRGLPGIDDDAVIARKDALASYHLAVTVDDAAQGVTHVIRGCDLRASTALHNALQGLLALPVPHYRHHPLIQDAQGQRLAKRRGSPSLADLRISGINGTELIQKMRSGCFPVGFSVQAP